jgi:hypothetical protein
MGGLWEAAQRVAVSPAPESILPLRRTPCYSTADTPPVEVAYSVIIPTAAGVFRAVLLPLLLLL